MAHGDLAQIAAVIGAAGSALVLLTPRRVPLLAGFAALVAAEVSLAVALVPSDDLARLTSAKALVACVLAGLAVVAAAAGLVRYPAAVPLLVLLAAPFRLPVDLGSQHAFLLLPLYGVLAASSLAFLVRTFRGAVVAPLAPLLAIPAAAFIGYASLSLLWALDLEQGSIQLGFFVLPFAALVAVVGRSPVASWLPRSLAVSVVGLAAVFAAIGIYQAWTHTLFFAQDLRVANAYTTFFRVTSVFKDPSIYGRHLVVGIVVLVVCLWLGRIRIELAAAAIALLFTGLYFSYSQSSVAVLFAATLIATLVLADRRSRRIVLVSALVAALAGGAFALVSAKETSIRKATSGRSRLVGVTTVVIRNHPVVGVGIGSQPLASRQEAKTRIAARRNTSHTTPLTVAAELGAIGLVLYAVLLASAAMVLNAAARARRELGLGLAAVFLCLFLHSLFYSGFFEDPLTWGVLGVASAALAAPVPAVARDRAPRTAAPAAAHASPSPPPEGDPEAGWQT